MQTMMRVEDAAQALGLSRTKTYALVHDGRLRSVKIGKSRRIPTVAVHEYIDGLSA